MRRALFAWGLSLTGCVLPAYHADKVERDLSAGDDPGAYGGLYCEGPSRSGGLAELTLRVDFVAAPQNPQPFSVSACEAGDPDCESPYIGPVRVDPASPVTLDLPVGFDGHLEITNSGALPAIFSLADPLPGDTDIGTLRAFTSETLEQLGLAASTPVDPQLGVVMTRVIGCDRVPLSGVVSSCSSGGPAIYFSSQSFPDVSQKSTGANGSAVFLNVASGLITVGGTLEITTFAASAVVVRSGWVSFVEVHPPFL